MARMNILSYPDSCSTRGFGQRVLIRGLSTFSFSVDASRKLCSHPFLAGSTISWASGSSTTLYYCLELPDTKIYAWRVEEDLITPLISIPEAVVKSKKWRVVGDKISYNRGTSRKAELVVTDLHGRGR